MPPTKDYIKSLTNDCKFISDNTGMELASVCIAKKNLFYSDYNPSISECESWLRLMRDKYLPEDIHFIADHM